MESNETFDLRPIRKVYSRIGWSLCTIIVAMLAVQLLLSAVLKLFWPNGCWLTDSSTGKWLINFVPQYLIAMPASILMLRRIPAEPPERKLMGAANFWSFLFICIFLMYGGNLIGNYLSMLLSGGDAQNALDEFALDSNPIKILFLVVLAPFFEELIFRKLLIDRTRIYGEKTAVFLSALTFALLHGNLFQFFYAFFLGWVFAYIYLRTGRLHYTVLLHSIINFMGGVVAPMILSMLDLEALSTIDPTASTEEILALYGSMLPGLTLYLLYSLVLLGGSVAGLVLLVQRCKKLEWMESPISLPTGQHRKAIYLSAGMLVFLIICGALTLLSVLL